ncbi:MAG: alpha-glycosidase [Firmicutes bacterium]|nr:alpha-glycosidase [Bacillota bacterium]
MNRHAIQLKAYPCGQNRLKVVLRCARGDIKSVIVNYGDRYGPPGADDAQLDRRMKLYPAVEDDLYQYWVGELELEARRFGYCFLLDDGQDKLWYSETGFSLCRPPKPLWRSCFEYPYLWWSEADEPPAWAREAVVYQIFPDRFANGDPKNDPPGTRPWGERPTSRSFFGGDLQGIIDHLDYLGELGINCLYLTPIFRAPSNHKYDTEDYLEIDPAFGDKRTARALVEACHAKGIRVVLDAVFNHCGYNFAPFQDAVRRGRRSPYFDWFFIQGEHIRTGPDCNYETFATGVWSMPKLRTDHPAVREYLIGAAELWTRELGIDGWRLDVGNEVHPEFWREFRRRIRAVNPEALIIGEAWHEASAFLQGDQMDAVMNYPWQHLCEEFFGRRTMDVRTFVEALNRQRMWYRESVAAACWNILDSHDCMRFLTACGGEKARLKLATVFQFTTIGAPYIFYGTEIGLTGGEDPDCRRCMPWDPEEWDQELLTHYKRLIRLRREHRVFAHGRQVDLVVEEETGLYAFARVDGSEYALVCLNTGDRPVVLDQTTFRKAAEERGLGGVVARPGILAFQTPSRESCGLRDPESGKVILPPLGAAVWIGGLPASEESLAKGPE